MPDHPLRAIRRAGVPLAVFETADPAATVQGCLKYLNGKADKLPLLEWDVVRGLRGLNELGRMYAQEVAPDGPLQTGNPAECLSLLGNKIPTDGIVFFNNCHRFLEDASVAQAIWNLRDTFKTQRTTWIGLAPTVKLPAELKQDVVVISEPLPDAGQVGQIVDSICEAAGIGKVENKDNVIDTLLGLSAFSAEQVLAMSISKEGIDRSGLWERKRKMVEQTPGLSVWRGGEKFADVGGCDNIKGFLVDIVNGRNAPRAVAFIDEIEKSMAGSGSDTSGVQQDYLRTLLTFMQDKEAAGVIFIGPPGAAKSAVAKAAGNEANIPTVSIDLGGMKGSLVGESEMKLRQALQVVDAISQGSTLFIATCNSIGVLPPELRRRFTLGTFFFDLPTADERKLIWKIYLKKYSLEGPIPPDEGWTGAEIRNCCQTAYRLKRTVSEAAGFIVPVAKAAADKIETLRNQASGRFISANYAGVYRYTPQASAPAAPAGRVFGV